ncbi:MAG: glutathione S-transferase family protein, partial [Gaiellales bacterium]
MSALVLYDNSISSNCLKVRFLLAELGLAYERRPVGFAWPRPEEYEELNPFGRLPTLVDGGLVLGESNAILRYLADREGRADLYPTDPAGRAPVEWALDAWATQVRPAFLAAEDVALMATGNWDDGGGRWEDADQDALKAALEKTTAALERFEPFTADNGTMLGTFTIADCCAAPVLWRSLRYPLDLGPFPKTARLRDALGSHPSFLAAGPVA